MADTGHGGLNWYAQNAANTTYFYVTSDGAHAPMTCGHCERDVSAAVLVRDPSPDAPVVWLRCPNCGGGSVANVGRGIEPGTRPGAKLRGLPDDVERAYTEARAAASVNAWTATEMMCRKILMHVAVDKGAEKGKSFAHYIDFLREEGYVPLVMKDWVDLIRKHGNEAVHDLPHIKKERGGGTFAFTEQLLRSTYEMAALAAQFTSPPPEAD